MQAASVLCGYDVRAGCLVLPNVFLFFNELKEQFSAGAAAELSTLKTNVSQKLTF